MISAIMRPIVTSRIQFHSSKFPIYAILLFERITIPRVNVKQILKNYRRIMNLQSNWFNGVRSSSFFYLHQKIIFNRIDINSSVAVKAKKKARNV